MSCNPALRRAVGSKAVLGASPGGLLLFWTSLWRARSSILNACREGSDGRLHLRIYRAYPPAASVVGREAASGGFCMPGGHHNNKCLHRQVSTSFIVSPGARDIAETSGCLVDIYSVDIGKRFSRGVDCGVEEAVGADVEELGFIIFVHRRDRTADFIIGGARNYLVIGFVLERIHKGALLIA